jgi:hypothetical protein
LSLLNGRWDLDLGSYTTLRTAASSLTLAGGTTGGGCRICVAEGATDGARLALEEVKAFLAAGQDAALTLELCHGDWS